jgi:hypothetical protein
MSDTAWDVDIYDDDYWRGFDGIMERRRYGLFAAMVRLDFLSLELSRRADAEFERQQATVSSEERERREIRARTMMALVVAANAMEDPVEAMLVWAEVDQLVFGPGAE